ncbi:MAG TPA: GDSL-type esterase/lipase family protein [Luteimonas sp.]|nr:GDSL-type esterase/lipase family protein [Luteimonas sp.]
MSADRAPPDTAPAPDWLALGDSYTIGEGVAADARWPVQLARALRAEGLAVGEARIVAATGWSTDELAAAVESADPAPGQALVSLAVGVNDQYRGRSVAQFDAGLAALLARAVELAGRRPGRVFMLTIPDWGTTPFALASGRDVGAIARELDAYNGCIAARCAAAGIACIDVTAAGRAAAGSPGMLADDGLHPSAAAYADWTQRMLPVVRALLRGAP